MFSEANHLEFRTYPQGRLEELVISRQFYGVWHFSGDRDVLE
jgi:hypothetical protein